MPPGKAPAAAWRDALAAIRAWPAWKQAAVAIACLAAVVWIVQTPWRPALGLLGFLTLAAVALAVDAGGLRGRVPLLRSADPRRVAGGWALVGAALLLAGALALAAGRGPAAPAGAQASHAASKPAPARTPPASATPSPVAAAPPPTPTPTPTATPPPTPRPTPTTTPVTFLNAPLHVQRGQTAMLRVQAQPGASCTIAIGYPAAPALAPAVADGNGSVSWTWLVRRQTPVGSWPIQVTCGQATGSTIIVVTGSGG